MRATVVFSVLNPPSFVAAPDFGVAQSLSLAPARRPWLSMITVENTVMVAICAYFPVVGLMLALAA